jgi:DDE family transposase
MNDDMLFYRASRRDCAACAFKARCCPKEPSRKLLRSIYEEARDVARAIAKTEAFEQSCRDRKRVEMLFAHLKRILRIGRLRLRGPRGAQFEFTLAAMAQNLRGLPSWSPERRPRLPRALRERRVAFRLCGGRWYQSVTAAAPTGASGNKGVAPTLPPALTALASDFCNKIGTLRPSAALQRLRPITVLLPPLGEPAAMPPLDPVEASGNGASKSNVRTPLRPRPQTAPTQQDARPVSSARGARCRA